MKYLAVLGVVLIFVLWSVPAMADADDPELTDITCGPEDGCVIDYAIPPAPKPKELLWIESLEARIKALEEKYEAMFPHQSPDWLQNCKPCGNGLLCCTNDTEADGERG